MLNAKLHPSGAYKFSVTSENILVLLLALPFTVTSTFFKCFLVKLII